MKNLRDKSERKICYIPSSNCLIKKIGEKNLSIQGVLQTAESLDETLNQDKLNQDSLEAAPSVNQEMSNNQDLATLPSGKLK